MSNKSEMFDDPLPRLTEVDQTDRIYRIVDFFSAAQALSGASLYVPLASTFDDNNEAIDAAIEHLHLSISAGPCAGMTTHFSSVDEFIEHQRMIAQRNYVSCWTKTKDSVAMWALYSNDHCSVQLATTVSNLEQAAIKIARSNFDPRMAVFTSAVNGQFLYKSKIASVKYSDLETVARSIDRRRRAYDKLEIMGRVLETGNILNQSKAENRRLDQYSFGSLDYKDASFAHESEVRLVLTFTPYNQDTLAIARTALTEMDSRPDSDPMDPVYDRRMFYYARAILRDEAWKQKLPCTPSISLPLQAGFITSVTVDPRCPPHKLRFMQKYFEALGIQIDESNCFGHMAKKFNVTPRRKLQKQNS